jgi:hypothetical protein
MDPQKEKVIENILEKNRSQGIKFYQTKEQLLSQGYTEGEIVYALFSAPYDVTPSVPRPANPLEQYYTDNPEKAQEIATILLQQQQREDWDQTAADMAAGQLAPDIQSRSYYDLLAADRLGIPFFTLTFASFALVIVAIKFNWSENLAYTVFAVFNTCVWLTFGAKLIHERIRTKKPNKS